MIQELLGQIPADAIGGLILKIFESGLLTALLSLSVYLLWRELKDERAKNDQLTDKIITNNIVMQEQLKDIIELLKDKRNNNHKHDHD